MSFDNAWPRVRVGDLGEVFTGRTPPTENAGYFGGRYPFITPGDMHQGKFARATERSISDEGAKLLQRIKLPANSVCVSCIGWQMGEVVLTDREAFTNQQINSIVPRSGVSASFLYYYFKTQKSALLSVGTTAGVRTPILNKSAFSNLKLPIPPEGMQLQIASILGAYDDLIEVNRRRIALLEKMAQRLFEEWFVRFRFPEQSNRKRSRGDSSGNLPPGWKLGELGELLNLAYGKALKSTDRIAGEVPVIGSSGIIGWHNEALVLRPGIVVGRKGNVGSVIWSPGSFFPIDTVFFVETEYPSRYVLHLLRTLPFQNSDAAVPGLNRGAALKLKVTIPPTSLCREYDRLAAPMLDMADVLQAMNVGLAASRDLLLPRLISGELSVAAAERELVDAA